MTTLLILYLVSGLLLVVLAIPLMGNKIPPNGFYGFRIKATMDDPNIWYAVNRHFSKYLLATGLAVTVSALAFTFVPEITINIYAWAVLAVFLGLFCIGVAISYRYMRRLVAKKQGINRL